MSDQKSKQPKVIVKKIYKKKFSLVNVLSTIIFVLTIILIISSLAFLGAILHTYKVFTQEKLVAEIKVSELKTKEDDKPYFTLEYIPYDDTSGFWGILGSNRDSTDESFIVELTGDQVFFRSDFVRWSDFMTLLNFKPVFKLYSIRSDFEDPQDYDKYLGELTSKEISYEMNGGRDGFSKKIQENSRLLTWFAQSVYISSAGIDIGNEPQTFYLKATEDALVIENS